MRVLVCPIALSIGGSQVNAVELAVAVQHRGLDVTLLSPPGPMGAVASRGGVRVVELITRGPGPHAAAVKGVRALLSTERFDLVHAYESVPFLQAYLGGYLGSGVPVFATVMSQDVPSRFPRSVPLTVGYPALADALRPRRSGPVHVLVPPVDTTANRPDVAPEEAAAFRRQHGVAAHESLVVIVSRLRRELKLPGLETLIGAARVLASTRPVRVAIVGGGQCAELLAAQAAAVNAACGRPVVFLTGELHDPRAAYASADVVVGMGSSALRGMAFAKPTIVVGDPGFSEVVTPETIGQFLRGSFHGPTQDRAQPDTLAAQIAWLLDDPDRRRRLGQFGRRTVDERFSLAAAGERLEGWYADAIAQHRPPLTRPADVVRTLAWVCGIKAKQRLGHGDARRLPLPPGPPRGDGPAAQPRRAFHSGTSVPPT